MLDFVATNFHQIDSGETNSLALVWSRSTSQLPIGEIRGHELVKRLPGFPFGLVLEHSFVQIDRDLVFHKPDPTLTSTIAVAPLATSIGPYGKLNGFELTWHNVATQV